MTKEERKKANKDQINKFLSAYYSEWRYIKILTIQKLLKDKYEFYPEILDDVKKTDKSVGEHTIAQEITNGLYFDAIQYSIQYIEDLFALISACQKEEFFIRNIIQYKSGKINNSISAFKNEKKHVCKNFLFPFYTTYDVESEEQKKGWELMHTSIDRLGKIVLEVIDYYKKHLFFYNQYKHGLSVALRPYGDYDKEQIEKDKNGGYRKPYLAALDSLNFRNAEKNQTEKNKMFMMPVFTENMRPFIDQFQKENNFLRYVVSHPDTTLDKIVEITSKTKRCMQILLHNFNSLVNDEEKFKLRLPAEDDDKDEEYTIDIEDRELI